MNIFKRLFGHSIASYYVYNKKGEKYKLRIKYKGLYNEDRIVQSIFNSDAGIQKVELISKTLL